MFRTQHQPVTLDTGTFSHTKQSCKDECDINNILKQYQKTGIMNHVASSPAQYLNLPDELDYQASLQIVKDAEYAFFELPSKLRDRFQNDPETFLAALGNPELRSELETYGLFKAKPPSPAPAPAEPLAPAAKT
ncbi:MAG: internal scaffolding protein [Microvirus sp.]|nr:MAG: internal scaffolding protein [Microvirus sp.]